MKKPPTTTKEHRLEMALRVLVAKSLLIQSDLCDQDTGWYYQFGASLENAENVISKIERLSSANVAEMPELD